MKIIEKIADMIDEEIEGAEQYMHCALNHKESHPTLASAFYQIATEEMRHIDMLHAEVTKIISEHRASHGEPPAAMMAVWEYVHKKDIERVAKIKMLMKVYRGE